MFVPIVFMNNQENYERFVLDSHDMFGFSFEQLVKIKLTLSKYGKYGEKLKRDLRADQYGAYDSQDPKLSKYEI